MHGETSKETPSAGKTPPYNKAVYQSYAADPQKSFRSLYNYCYTLIKPPCVVIPPFLSLPLTLSVGNPKTSTWRFVPLTFARSLPFITV